MPANSLTRSDILPIDDYVALRDVKRAEVREIKRNRRVSVGPFATFYFENFDTMWLQIHEMLFIEKGGEDQIGEELDAYAPLVPNGQELVATLMFEIDEPERRNRELEQLGGVETTVTLSVGNEVITAKPADEVERTTMDGKTSSVHFLRFLLNDIQIAVFLDPSMPVALAINHENYPHTTTLSESVRAALAEDFVLN